MHHNLNGHLSFWFPEYSFPHAVTYNREFYLNRVGSLKTNTELAFQIAHGYFPLSSTCYCYKFKGITFFIDNFPFKGKIIGSNIDGTHNECHYCDESLQIASHSDIITKKKYFYLLIFFIFFEV